MTIARVRRPAARCATVAASLAVCSGLTMAAAPSASGAPGDHGRTILISDARFVPADIGVFPGTTVVWINTDQVQHNVDSTDGPQRFGTGEHALDNGQSFRFRFTKPGVYHFACWLNGHMSGSVTVGERAFTEPPSDHGRPDDPLEFPPSPRPQ
ncbi:MAG TPA: plastocyanin/azurin family copper-binding protein [Sporichthyaceae bacterium]|jgi:plastocyanin|nr:plastocyanin/azurin family copper-binding protein [Sporichthyaceae bacterium]